MGRGGGVRVECGAWLTWLNDFCEWLAAGAGMEDDKRRALDDRLAMATGERPVNIVPQQQPEEKRVRAAAFPPSGAAQRTNLVPPTRPRHDDHGAAIDGGGKTQDVVRPSTSRSCRATVSLMPSQTHFSLQLPH